ncbi:MAG: carotenoid 1,2-hydratase [Proteobacteria bacterium]|nr:carotenoid 1,2-hydratase [Pseudomonadota bacterium]
MRWAVWSAMVLCCVARAGAPPSQALDVLRDSAKGFTRADAPRTFEFPRDHGPHPDFRHEWWYMTGNLDSDTGERFGFEVTVFRVGLAPPGSSVGAVSDVGGTTGADAVSAWRTREVYVAHFAITDVARGVFKFSDRYSRGALGLAGARADPMRAWIDDWQVGASKIHARGEGYELTLDVGTLGDPVLNGDHGLSRKSSEPGSASYYYSIPRIAVHGAIARGGAISHVHGLAWLDREWGSGSLGAGERGWDWFAFQLQDGSTLMFYSLRQDHGTRDPNSAGTWVDASGHSRPLSNDQVSIDVIDHWTSPRGGRYPSRWRVRVPSTGLDVEVRPVLADQELATRPRYWEGAVDLRGVQSGRDISGRGYVELVGYGE